MICVLSDDSVYIVADECLLVDQQVIITVTASSVLFRESGVQVSGVVITVILIVGFHPERAVVAPEVELYRMVRCAVFDGLAEIPVDSLAAPFAYGFERDDLPVDTGSGGNAVFVEVLAVIGIPDFADERACESCLGGFALELADQAAVGFRRIFGGRRPE